MKLLSVALFCTAMLATSLCQAATWELKACTGELSKFGPNNSADNERGRYILNVTFNDQTGEGRGEVRIYHRVRGQDSINQVVALQCSFLTKSKYGAHVMNSADKPFVLCETNLPIVANQKFGIPFYRFGFGFPTNLSTYVQLENGNDGAGGTDHRNRCLSAKRVN